MVRSLVFHVWTSSEYEPFRFEHAISLDVVGPGSTWDSAMRLQLASGALSSLMFTRENANSLGANMVIADRGSKSIVLDRPSPSRSTCAAA